MNLINDDNRIGQHRKHADGAVTVLEKCKKLINRC